MIVDLIIVAIIILAILIGMKKGLTVCLVNIFAVIIAIVVALAFCNPLAEFAITKTEIGENVKQVIKNNIPMSGTEINIQENKNLPQGIQEYINQTTKNINETKENSIDTIAEQLAKQVITVISFILIFILVRAILLIIKVVSKLINKLPILKQIDHIGGAVCGFIEGLVLVYVIFAGISMCAPAIKNTKILTEINNSYIGKNMYNNNMVVKKIYNVK